jgi:hypothetical protein
MMILRRFLAPWGGASALQPGFRAAGRSKRLRSSRFLTGMLVCATASLHAETGYDAWLRYAAKFTLPVPAVLASTTAVSNWFLRESGIADAKGRVGHYPGRFEAESMQLQGYEVKDVSPWEAASGQGHRMPDKPMHRDAAL